MDLDLPEQTEHLRTAIQHWAKSRLDWPRTAYEFDPERWAQVLSLGVLDAEAEGGSLLDVAVGLMEIAHVGLPGPLLEAQLALATGSSAAASALASGRVVTSARPVKGRLPVGWGGVADLVIDQDTGNVITEGALPVARLSYPMPHGWLVSDHEPANSGGDPLATRRWVLGGALLVGLADAATTMTCDYAKVRVQFKRPIGAFQAVQTRLVDSFLLVRAARLAVLDAAWRDSEARPDAAVAAALAWLGAFRAAQTAETNCHQVFGATGFTFETGLEGLVWPMWWIRESVGRRTARDFLTARRRPANAPITNVFEAFEGAAA